ncbi:LL-diaminopimelate aminotransferase [Christensenellaceae bacterium NSJ-44]|uniref:LL-diaminopimelate aminotransferase n=1 Tax=Luoshenia tenuis TaxID=2763654 RepID=A0A926D1Q7_9FIRM|nr:LL-diaminopimelate aminotransferase [Luoshenia tenuis]MBC8528705.1 LL-diaminopimelate aminotransferase [Luoshenia tenuis]
MRINTHYQDLEDSYLFSTIAKKVAQQSAEHPEQKIIRLGIGDVTLPLCPAVTDALHAAVDEMGNKETFHGYGPEQGYDFLREGIRGYYVQKGVVLEAGEVFISDGAKSDLGNILDLFDRDNTVLVPDPVYPVYVDTNVMAGRKILYCDATEQNGFLPPPPQEVEADIIYLCSPNNPTGAAYNREQLGAWVAYARAVGAVILYDAAYEAFIQDESLPRSIYEIEGAKQCAIEFCSLSKTAGFTGLRCGYTVVPLALCGGRLNAMWLRRQTTKFNGVPYIVQRAAAAVFTPEGLRQIEENLGYYRENARIMAQALREMGVWFTGGESSPYIFMKCPGGMDSWQYFDLLLKQAGVVGTPGEGFGKNGAGFFRLTAFGEREATKEAMARIRALHEKL